MSRLANAAIWQNLIALLYNFAPRYLAIESTEHKAATYTYGENCRGRLLSIWLAMEGDGNNGGCGANVS